MPPRRPTPSVTALPTSRLPVGTPALSTTTSPSPPIPSTATQTSQRSAKLRPTYGVPDAEETPRQHPHSITTASSFSMSAPTSQRSETSAAALAAAKLARQNQRIQQADAALTVPPPADRMGARGKSKVWKPFDFNAEPAHLATNNEGGVPVSEIRINTFRSSTRDSSMSRSMSSLSQRTSGTTRSDMERQDASFADGSGFQLYTGRKGRKHTDYLNAYEDRGEEKQKTVEATIDPRDIYNVFGNALPAPDFIDQSPGFRNGQVQFVQHPNGDVSAHQWSDSRYIWENIGQFSNIRKKVEGQLAADRLKAQTAHQTLQQNSLAYFRTVAKQREANVTGETFGVKEIQALLPDLQPALASPLPKKVAPSIDAAESSALEATHGSYEDMSSSTSSTRHPAPSDSSFPRPDQSGYWYSSTYAAQRHVADQKYPYSHNGQGVSASGTHYNPHFLPSYASAGSGQLQDPFYSDQSYRAIYGNSLPYQEKAASSHSYHKPDYGHKPFQSTSHDTQFAPASNESGHGLSGRFFGDAGTASARLKPATPLNPRTAMRESLVKITEQAKERSLSQANIGRTVLFDPFHAQTASVSTEPPDTVKPPTSELKRTVANPSGIVPPKQVQLNKSSGEFNHSKPSFKQPTTSNSEDLWSTNDGQPYGLFPASGQIMSGPQSFNGPFFGDLPGMPGSAAKKMSSQPGAKTREQELKDWWNGGNTFARQQDFYHRIKGSNPNTLKKSSADVNHSSSPASLPPIGTPLKDTSKSTSMLDADDPMTRLLIPVLENLTSYTQGLPEKRRDYFCQWSQAPEWCIDRSATGNRSFFDTKWEKPPARVGRDPRYRPLPIESVRFGGFGSPQHVGTGASGLTMSDRLAVGSGGLDGRFAIGGSSRGI